MFAAVPRDRSRIALPIRVLLLVVASSLIASAAALGPGVAQTLNSSSPTTPIQVVATFKGAVAWRTAPS